MCAVEAVSADEAADTAHGAAGIDECRMEQQGSVYTEVKGKHNS